MKSTMCFTLLLSLLLLAGSFAHAQFEQINPAGQAGQNQFLSATSVQLTTSNYYFAKPNELTIIVNVVGYVQRPGRYEISKSIDLVNLIALAGGAATEGTLSDVKVTRLLEGEGRITRGEFQVNLEDLTKMKPGDLALSPGDVVQVGRSAWPFWRDAFSVVISAAVIVTAISNVIIARRF